MQFYVDEHGRYPDGEDTNPDLMGPDIKTGRAPLGWLWHVDIIPYLREAKRIRYTSCAEAMKYHSNAARMTQPGLVIPIFVPTVRVIFPDAPMLSKPSVHLS